MSNESMDAAESGGTSSVENAGATEVERVEDNDVSPEAASTIESTPTSDCAKERSSRRKPYKTHKVVDSEDEGDEDEDEQLEEKAIEGLSDSGHEKNRDVNRANSSADDGDEEEGDDEEEEEMEEEELEEAEDPHQPHLPEGTVVVQPMAAEDSAPYRPPDIPYGRKTRTDVIPDHVMCTACEHRIPTNSIDHFYRHPVLRVLLCRRCIAVYEAKPIRMGDDGLDDACRWCAEGGDLICCDFCNNAFCKGCIERNLGRQELHSILNADDNVKWHCYACHPQLLAKHVESCNAIIASVEEREKVARRRQKTGSARSPRKSSSQMGHMPDTAALASAIASQVMSAGRRGRPRGRGSLTHGTSKGDVIYIRTPGGGVVGIPAKNVDQLANLPLTPGQVGSPAKPRGSRSLRGSSHRAQFASIPSLPMTSVTLSSSPPNINEYNVWSVLEKLLAATQSMGMLLGSLKDDIRRTGNNLAAIEQLKKRREVAMKLWRAFVAYKKSFLDIEIFTRGGNGSPGNQGGQQARAHGASSRVAATVKGLAERATKETDENGGQTAKEGDDRGSTGQKRTVKQDEETHPVPKKRRLESEEQSPEDPEAIRKNSMLKDDEASDGEDSEDSEDGDSTKDKSGDVFGSMHFEPLFEIKPIVKKE